MATSTLGDRIDEVLAQYAPEPVETQLAAQEPQQTDLSRRIDDALNRPTTDLFERALANNAEIAARQSPEWNKRPSGDWSPSPYQVALAMRDPQAAMQMPSKPPPTRLEILNRYRKEAGLPPVESLPERRGVGEVWREDVKWTDPIPYVGVLADAVYLGDVYDAALRAEDGRATANDWELLVGFQEQLLRESQEKTIPAHATNILIHSIPFMVEFLTSGGLIAGGKAAGKKAAKGAAKKGLSAAIKTAMGKATMLAAESAARTPFFSHRIGAETIRRMIPEFQIAPDEMGDFQVIVVREGESLAEAAKNAGIDIYIEIGSESTGPALAAIGRKTIGKAAIKPAKRILAKDFLARAGYHGVLEEMGEERVGEVLREAVTRLGIADLPQTPPTGRQLAAEALAFSVPAAGGAAASQLIRPPDIPPKPAAFPLDTVPAEPTAAPEPEAVPKPLEVLSREEQREWLNTDEGATQFVRVHPEAADEIVRLADARKNGVPPSQRFHELSGLPPRGRGFGTSENYRREVAHKLRRALYVREPVAEPSPMPAEIQRLQDAAAKITARMGEEVYLDQTGTTLVDIHDKELPRELIEQVLAEPAEIPALPPSPERAEEEPELPDLETLNWDELKVRAKALGVKVKGTKQRLIEDVRHAREIRRNERLVQEEGLLAGEGEGVSGPDVQQAAEARPEAGKREVPREEVVAKQPWQMTQEEFSTSEIPLVSDEQRFPQIRRVRRLFSENGIDIEDIGATGSQAAGVAESSSDVDIYVKVPKSQFHPADDIAAGLSKEGIDVLVNWRGIGVSGGTLRGIKTHKRLVARALAEGKPVPAEVLNEYPDLRTPQRSALSTKAATARKEFMDELDETGKFLQGRLFSAPLDPEVAKRVAVLTTKAIKAGVYTFADFINELANRLSSHVVRKLAPALQTEWAKFRRTNNRLDEPSDVEAILAARTGRPELANMGITPLAREVQRDVDERRKAEGRPETRPIAEIEAAAEARIARDRAGERARLLDLTRGEGAEAFQAEDVVIAERIFNEDVLAAHREGNEQKLREAMELADSVREKRAEWGRAGRMMRDKVQTPEERLAYELATPPETTLRKIKQARRDKDPETVKVLMDAWVKESQEIRDILAAHGIDLATIDLTNEKEMDRALRNIQALKASTWDVANTIQRNAMLSAPKTLLINFGGNWAHAAWYYTTERVLHLLVNSILNINSGPSLAETRYVARGIIPGLAQACCNTVKAWNKERPILEEQLGLNAQGGHRLDMQRGVAITDWKGGRVIRVPQRGMLVGDEFFKVMITYAEVGAQAYRIARQQEGKEDENLEARVAELVADKQSPAWAAAYDRALDLAWQKRLGSIGKHVLAARRELPWVEMLLFKFVTTPTNIIKRGIRKSPLGIFGLPSAALAAKRAGHSDIFVERAVEQIIAWGVVVAVAWTLDPDDPWITGAAQASSRSTREMGQRMGYEAQTIRIPFTNGKRISYARAEPFATALSFIVDMVLAAKTHARDIVGLAGTSAQNIVGQLRDKTFFQQISDVVTAFDERDPINGVAKWASNWSTTWVPNIVKVTNRDVLKADYPERRIWGEEKLKHLGKRTLQRTELPVIGELLWADQPKVDIWGRNAERWAPNTGIIWKMLSPLHISQEKVLPGDQLIFNWNLSHPERGQGPGKRYEPMAPSYSYTFRGTTHYMTEEQYTEYLRLAGQRARAKVDAMLAADRPLNVDEPTQRDIDAVERALEKGRDQARHYLIRKWHGKKNAP